MLSLLMDNGITYISRPFGNFTESLMISVCTFGWLRVAIMVLANAAAEGNVESSPESDLTFLWDYISHTM